MKYLLPNYERGDRYLKQIAKRAHRITYPIRIKSNIIETENMLTFGYLGNVARRARQCQRNSSLSPYCNVLIADHGFGPKHLRNNLYRLAIHDKNIRGIELNNNQLLTNKIQDEIYSHLKYLQEDTNLRLTGQWLGETAKTIALLVEPAPVLVELQLEKRFDKSEYQKQVAQRAAQHNCCLFLSRKRVEIGLTEEGERKKTINNGAPEEINKDQVAFAACPTSMIALDLILKGIPVDLSPIHPLVDQLGLFIPSLTAQEALETVYETICRTTFCMRRVRKVEEIINQFEPLRAITQNSVKL